MGGGGRGVGDTHFTSSHIGETQISLGICVREYTYHGDTHITVTTVWPSPPDPAAGALFKAPDSRIQGGSYFLITLRANWIRPDFLVDFCLISGYVSAWGLNLTKYDCLYSPRFLTWLRPQLPLRQKYYHLWSWFVLFQFSNLNIYLPSMILIRLVSVL